MARDMADKELWSRKPSISASEALTRLLKSDCSATGSIIVMSSLVKDLFSVYLTPFAAFAYFKSLCYNYIVETIEMKALYRQTFITISSKGGDKMKDVDIMPDSSEIVHYDEAGIPLYIRSGRLSTYPDMKASCHWHEDFEFIHILEGEMNYSINGKTVLLREGDSIFVNSRQMHYGYEHERSECIFICVLVHPELITSNRKLYERFVEPVLSDAAQPYAVISAAEDALASKLLLELSRLKEEHAVGYEIYASAILSSLFMLFSSRILTGRAEHLHEDEKLSAQKKMVAFIAGNYAYPLTLEDIASSANLSKSSCIRLFKTYANGTPFEFLNAYRLQAACDLLIRTGKSVTEIASLCGFGSVSFFTKCFRQKYHITPSAYRKAAKQE